MSFLFPAEAYFFDVGESCGSWPISKEKSFFRKKMLMAYGLHFWQFEAVLANSLNVRLMFERFGSFVRCIFLAVSLSLIHI